MKPLLLSSTLQKVTGLPLWSPTLHFGQVSQVYGGTEFHFGQKDGSAKTVGLMGARDCGVEGGGRAVERG